MSDELDPGAVLREVAGLGERVAELRRAAAMPAADPRAALDAALAELELAVEALQAAGAERAAVGNGAGAGDTERRVLRTVFQDAPVPLFLLDRDSGVRRVNRQAATLLGTSPGYVSGKQFTSFCDLATRGPLRSQLAAVVRTGRRYRVRVRFLGGDRPVDAVVTLARVWIAGEPDPMVMAVAGPTSTPTGDEAAAEERPAVRDDEAVAAISHRMDVLAAVGEMLLDEPVFNETVAVRRCARLLAAELADWAFIDLAAAGPGARLGDLRRQVVVGPAEDEHAQESVRVLESLPPGPLPSTVFATQQAALRPHVEDLGLLGADDAGQPVCGRIGATTVLAVPIEDGDRCLGTITLAGGGESGPFDLHDLAVVGRIGRQLALVIRASRLYRRRAEVADSLQASLLPKSLPAIPGVELAARYLTATHGAEVGGDFYDVFRLGRGWGLVLGDVCGKGEDAAAVTASARHGVRLAARWHDDPAEVLAKVNAALLDEDRFVTAVLAGLEVRDDRVVATLGIAGHPPAIVVRADGVIRSASHGGVPLGLFEDFTAGHDTVELFPGDTLFLHSDGVLDACDAARAEFGRERLLETLAGVAGQPLGALTDAVERALQEFCDGDLRDDVSMLALRVSPPEPL
ncbi:SpoIIE family protein phosphatase [Actinomadura atramentaria]|uniref:SpoIIE family protein phosphatase n=1 Tax=Actinomadura atramentaria TaxID=1990 RepID=UPI00039A04D4|nr:SpoIIE family protein phosphatase [Actinomadura atramentaria]